MTAWTFSLRAAGGDRLLGAALICPEARYCSARWAGIDRLDRRFVSPASWKAIEGELADRLPTTPLPGASQIYHAFRHPDLTVSVTYVSAVPIVAPAGADTLTALDSVLRGQPLA